MKKTVLLVLIVVHSSSIFSQDQGTGDNTTAEDFKKILKAAYRSNRDLLNLPSSFSIKQFAPGVQHQGKLNTCVGWSSAYAARTICYAIKNKMTNANDINKNSFSPGYLYYKIKDSTDAQCMKGSNLFTALEMLTNNGAMLKKEGIADCTPAIPLRAEQKKAAPYKIKTFLSISENFGVIDTDDIKRIKKAISENKPVVISLRIDKSFKTISSNSIWAPTTLDEPKSGHAMCVVGYNDTIQGGAFEVMNSWGTKWGNAGFAWLSYELMKSYGKFALELMDYEAPSSRGFGSRNLEISGSIEFIRWGGRVLPVTKTKNAGGITVQGNSNDDNKIYRITDTLKRGNWFQVKFSAGTPSYIYIFAQDEAKKVSPFFPQDSTISAAINSPNSSYYLPDEVTYGVIKDPGKENICILYSKSEIDIKDLRKYIDSEKTTIHEAVKFKLAKRLLDLKTVKFGDDKIIFQAPADENSVLCFYVELNHN